MELYLDPKNDLVFRKIFGEHSDLLISFLNALMPFEKGRYIEDLEYLPSEQAPILPGVLKSSIVDVKCKDNYGRHFIIEMQVIWHESFKFRMLFNTSKALVYQLKKGETYKYLQPVYGLAIVNRTFDEDGADFYHHYKVVNIADTNEQIEGLELVFVELPKFRPETVSDKKMMVLWLRFLKEIKDHEPVPEDLKESAEISKAIDICRQSAFTPAELDGYDRYWDAIRTYNTVMSETLMEGRKEGQAEGWKEGRKEGQEEGRKEGFEKGEKSKTLEIAQTMKKLGATTEFIVKSTGLSENEISQM